MKKILLVSLITLSVVLLAVFLVIPAFAQDEKTTAQEQWQAMYEACQSGDWQAMQDAMQQVDWDDMPCHQGYPTPQNPQDGNTGSNYQWGGMGGGMMGGGGMGGFGHMGGGGMMGW